MNNDLIEGYQRVATLDEDTCLECLLLDGTRTESSNPVKHSGCRCVLVPTTKSWKDIGFDIAELPEGTRASAIGQIKENGGIYKKYLVERARQKAQNLLSARSLLASLEGFMENNQEEKSEYLKIKLGIYSEFSLEFDKASASEMMSKIEWPSPGLEEFLSVCHRMGMQKEVKNKLESLTQHIRRISPTYASRHISTMYYKLGNEIKKTSVLESVQYFVAAYKSTPNASNGLELLKCYKALKDFGSAKKLVIELVQNFPTSRSILKEHDSKWMKTN